VLPRDLRAPITQHRHRQRLLREDLAQILHQPHEELVARRLGDRAGRDGLLRSGGLLVRPENRREELNVLRRPAQRRQAGGRYLDAPTDFVKVRSRYWPKVIVSLVTLDATKVPRPARDSVRPSTCRRPRASRTMGRLTPNRRFGWQPVVDLHLP
jgi:hypothetical protein